MLLKSSSPVDVNCTLIGGTMALSRQLDGASVGACQLANGKRCSEQSLMNGSCPAG
ncbi:YdbJ [Pectobacterium sp. F1-1]|nr:YdbJ [Pectobacterium sp. F1-1]